jgi:hypothetical protein
MNGYAHLSKFALLVELKAKPGKESEVEAFLKKEAALTNDFAQGTRDE